MVVEGIDKELTPEQLAYQRILRSVSISEQSTNKMRKKLQASGFDDAVIDVAICRAIESNALNDVRYSECLVRSTIALGKGVSFAEHEIDELGININDLESYQEYLKEGNSPQIEAAISVLTQHPPRAKNKKEAAYRKLISKGFSNEIALDAISEWSSNLDNV